MIVSNFFSKPIMSILLVCIGFSISPSLLAQDPVAQDSLSRKEVRELKREELKIGLKNSHQRGKLGFDYVFANLETTLTFEVLDGHFLAKLSLENDLNLPKKKNFFMADFYYRFTPRSSVYGIYYGINRSVSSTVGRDIIFEGDTIFQGTDVYGYFNTQVVSVGYMYSLLTNPKNFLGVFFNVYTMLLKTGIKTDINSFETGLNATLPLPNFGLIGSFRVYDWFYITGSIGVFSLQAQGYGGKLSNANLALEFKPIKQLGINLNYTQFDIEVDFPSDRTDAKATVEYNFRGPGVGISYIF